MYVDNEIAPYKFNYTPQYKLLKTLDLKNLQLLNVQYIFDLSNIYDSYYYKYVPAETYDNDLSLIKNNPNFFSILLANNPGQIEKVSAHIYKILNIQPYITSFAKLYQLGSTTQELPEFLSGSVEDRYYANFQNGNNAALPATKVDELFAKVDGSRIATETLKLNSDNLNTIYALSGKDVFVKQNGKKIIIYSEANSSVILNGKEVPINSENTLIKTITIDPLKNYYIRLENSTVPLLEGQGVDLGSSSLTKHIVLYEASGNVLENGSFEDGTWKTNVEDCSAYDEAAVIGMSLSVDEKTAGEKSLQLEASRHVACTSQVAKVVGGKDYVLSFDYQSPNAADASYYVGYNDEGKSAIDKHISISSNKWKRYQETITIPMGASQAALFFYARPYWERSQSIINRYDNVTLEKLDLVQDITLSPSDMIVKKLLNEDLPNTVFKYDSKREDPVNVVPNGSFENGGWQERVGDCGNYDSNPDIAMKVDSATSTEGKQSIYLSAKRHTACTSLSIPVNEGRRYSLSFDYQSPTKSRASFYVDFDGSSDVVMRKELPIETPSWQTYTTDIAIPSGAKMMRLYVYAMESDKSAENVNRYDNFRLAELPDVDERYYVASDPLLNTQKPSSIQFEVINTTNKKVHITHAVAPFYLVMSESYHPKWRLELNNSLSIGWMPVPSVDAIDESNHFELNNALNGWYIDPVELCGTKGSLKDGCTMNEDGSYNMELIIEFTPQRWFYVGLIISGTTLLSCLLYLGYDFVKKNRKRKRIKNTP